MIWVLFVLYFYVLELVIKSESFDLYCSWECLKEILVGDWTDGILCSIGMPVIKGSERYNCQVLCFNRKIIMIRPKMWLANDGNNRELRWFTAWKHKDQLVDFQLPSEIAEAISQKSVHFGYGYVQFLDT
jgi:NAD+ synthase (glutamine-hydrolysing)